MLGDTYLLKVKPEDLKIVIENKAIKDIKSATAVNGTFFWQGKPNGIIVSAGKVIGDQSSHAWRGYPQSVIYRTTKGAVKIAKISNTNQILSEGIDWAIGGLGILTPYGYNPASEGFSGAYADVLRVTNKTFMGYNKAEDTIYICVRKNSSHDKIIENVKELKLNFAISLDGGGSSSIKVNNKVIISGDGRKVNNYIVLK